MPDSFARRSSPLVTSDAIVSSWNAPYAVGPLDWTVRVPGSKSATARAFYLAAIAQEPTRIFGALSSRDTDLMASALESLGAGIKRCGDSVIIDPWDVTRVSSSDVSEELTIHVGLAGTVMRFVPLLAALRPGVTHFRGDVEAEQRPLAPLVDVARQLGAHVTFHGREGFLPFSVTGVAPGSVFPEEITVDASASSQFLSAALLVAPLLGARDGREHRVRAPGKVVSLPHVHMTVESLRSRGITVEHVKAADGVCWRVSPGLPSGGELSIEPDLTNAGVFLVAGMLAGGIVRILDWPERTTQAGDAWRRLLSECGARFSFNGTTLEMLAPPLVTMDRHAAYSREDASSFTTRGGVISVSQRPRFDGKTWDFSAIGELTPTAVALLLFADSPSHIHSISHIRGHETDRLSALTHEIRALGGTVVEHPDGLTITPTPLSAPADGQPLRAYADHRMATFAALVGLRVPGVTVDDIACTSKTLPGFAQMWASLLVESDSGKD